jgi:quercetin dioxygenase-like cupin family protein
MSATATLERQALSTPDETRTFLDGKGKVDIVTVGGVQLGRGVFEPGWRWSDHVKPIAGTDSCQAVHTGYVIQGRMVVRMDDGAEIEVSTGDAFYMPAGHDAWVVGDQPCILIDISGMSNYARPE